MQNKYYPHLASPITINGVTFKNRIFGAPMSNPEMDPDCNMRKEDIAFHEYRSQGGLASVAIGLGIVDAIGRSHTKEVKLYDVLSLPSLKEAANAMHRHNCLAVMELAHGGKFGNARGHGGSDDTLIGPNDEVNAAGLNVRSMTDDDIHRVAECFGNGAKLSKEAGFDMVLIHGGHGWLLGQFSSPTLNQRTDKWGGSLENRMRFPLLVIEKVREAVGADYPIEFRMSGAEYTDTGYTIEEGIEMAKMIDGKVDIIHVSAGIHEEPYVFTLTTPSMFIENGYSVHLAAAIKKHVKTPVATVGGLSSPEMMEEIIASGKADIVQIARQSLSDPYFPEKAFSGNADDISRCCRCYTCFFNYLANRTYCCAFNPVVGNELENKHAFPVTTPKKVIVVGGGPGGMQAAITAAKRGHTVTLYEKSSELGGLLLSEKHIPFKKEMYNFVKVLEGRLKKAGVEVCLNIELTAEQAAAKKVDVIITAVGAKQIMPKIAGIDNEKVVGLEALHQTHPALGQKVVVLGGGLVGCECSIYLNNLGKDVTVVEMKDDWATDAYWMHKNAMILELEKSTVEIKTGVTAKAVTDKGLVCETETGEVVFEADSILVAAGMHADRLVADSFYNAADRVFQVGDCIKPGLVLDAVTTGYYRALDI